MTKRKVKKVITWSVSVFLVLVLVLGVHIYWVTRPKPPDEHTRIMARIDIKDPITQADADKIKTWLYQQKGIDHVMVNPKTSIAVFTFFPIKTSGDAIAQNFKAAFNYDARRYMPTEAEMQGGCPVAATSVTYKVYSYIKHIF